MRLQVLTRMRKDTTGTQPADDDLALPPLAPVPPAAPAGQLQLLSI